MIELFELVRYLEVPSQFPRLVTRRNLLTSQDALLLTRQRLEEEHRIDHATLSFLQDKSQIDLQINPKEQIETILFAGQEAIPETVLASLASISVSELAKGCLIIDEIFRDRMITDSYYCNKLKLLRVSVSPGSLGWWFERNRSKCNNIQH